MIDDVSLVENYKAQFARILRMSSYSHLVARVRSVTGAGAGEPIAAPPRPDVVVAYFDWPSKQYRNVPINEQVEVLSFAGDISIDKGEPKVHAHVVLGKADATAHGGHLIEGHVRPTLELVLTEMPRHLHRRFDVASGLALIDPSAAGPRA